MFNKSMWWLFLLGFGVTIGAIHSLSWWARPAAAHAQVSQPVAPAPQVGEPTHWRSLVMHQ